MTISVDLGCGRTTHNPYKADKLIGVDPIIIGDDILNVWVGLEKIPLEDSSVDFVTAYDFLEHLPRFVLRDDKPHNCFIEGMNEIYRILKPGGKLFAQTPAFPHKEAFQDPTHVNIITEASIGYFDGSIKDLSGNEYGALYGFNGKFKRLKQQWLEAWLQWELEAIK